jgi:hypothetical protein
MSDVALFRQRVNETFTVHLDDGRTHDLVLTECLEQSAAVFSLTFAGGPQTPAQQGTYLVGADDLEPTPIFLVPGSKDDDGVTLHAVFNQPSGEEPSA